MIFMDNIDDEINQFLKVINDYLCAHGLIYCENCEIKNIDDLLDVISDFEVIVNRLRMYKFNLIRLEQVKEKQQKQLTEFIIFNVC